MVCTHPAAIVSQSGGFFNLLKGPR